MDRFLILNRAALECLAIPIGAIGGSGVGALEKGEAGFVGLG
jgi:hypothetical protein